MPTFACDDCGKAFDSKDALREHMEGAHGDGGASIASDVAIGFRRGIDNIRNFSLKQLGILGAVFLMATLFVGTAFFASVSAPATGGGGNQQGQYVNPLTGERFQELPQASLPTSPVVQQPLTAEQQVYLFYRGSPDNGPGIMLGYNCTDCQGTVAALASVANSFQGYVYVTPHDSSSRVTAATFGQVQRFDTANASEISAYVCRTYQRFPVRFRPLDCGLQGGT